MKQLQDECAPCTRCGMCQATCPLFEATGKETDTARGKLAIIYGIMEGILSDATRVSEKINRCLLCGSCATKCPRNIRPHEIIIRARSILTEYMGLSSIHKIIFRFFLARPDRFDKLAELGAKGQNMIRVKKDKASKREFSKLFAPFLSSRFIKPLSPHPFHQLKNTIYDHTQNEETGRKKIRVALFTGCLIDKLYPETGISSYKVLIQSGMDVYIPDHQGCCGMPSLASGDMNSFKKLVLHHLALFPTTEFDYCVSACATCSSTIKYLWPSVMRNEPPDIQRKIAVLASKTVDICQLVCTLKKVENKPDAYKNAIPVTYHAPCHQRKSFGIEKEPLLLIKENPHYQLVEMENADTCCGFGGSFNLKYHDISSEIGMKKRASILKTGAKKVITGCPACMIQLQDIFNKNGDDISVVHIMDIVSETVLKDKT
ncbi:MAG: (Fe-S)-binding protein [Proteobacteria bacterium]|nr:(Fe-S)-binding protein [Pseudomonadota bacterium]